MTIPTEPIGSIPRPQVLIDGMQAAAAGQLSAERLDALYEDAVRDTLQRFEATGSPVVTDGEQRKPSFATYPVAGLALGGGGVTIPFEDGHTRQLPTLTSGPFRYATYAWSYLDAARGHTAARRNTNGCFVVSLDDNANPADAFGLILSVLEHADAQP